MPRRQRLTDATIARLRPEPREYTVWDTRVPGLGVRVRPSGSRTYVHHRTSGAGVKKVSLGPATLRGIEEVRRACLASATAEPTGRNDAPLLRDFVAGAWKRACYERWKPSTQKSTRSALESQLLPVFGALRLDRISRVMVVRWYETYSRSAPGGANQVLGLLRQILNHALVCGHVATNPARHLRRNPRPPRTRFLSREEIRSIHRALDRHATRSVSKRQQADIIRLLLLTGCRKNEIVRLRWREVDGDRLNLSRRQDRPETGAAQRPGTDSHRTPDASGETAPGCSLRCSTPARPQNDGLPLWYTVRREAGIEDVRLHDLRHSVATHAVMAGVALPVVARLLGHRDPSMTLRYAHVGDAEVEAAAERVGLVIARCMAGTADAETPAAGVSRRQPLAGRPHECEGPGGGP